MSTYSISFCFENEIRYGLIEMPIENLSTDSPAAQLITKKLSTLGCNVIKHTLCWGVRKSPDRKRCCYSPMIKFTGSTEAMQQLVKLYGFPGQQVPEKATRVFQDKFLWRGFVQDLFPEGTGTPVFLKRSHLPSLEAIASSTSTCSSDVRSLNELIKTISEDGEAVVID